MIIVTCHSIDISFSIKFLNRVKHYDFPLDPCGVVILSNEESCKTM